MPENGATNIPPINAPIVLMDAGPLIALNIARKNLGIQDAGESSHPFDPFRVLALLAEPDKSTLVIPRAVLQEVLKTDTSKRQQKVASVSNLGPLAGSGDPLAGYALLLPHPDDTTQCNNQPILSFLHSLSQKKLPDGRPFLRYYHSPDDMIAQHEVTGRSGGIVILDTPELGIIQPLNKHGQYSKFATGMGDDQIVKIMKLLHKHYDNNLSFPMVSTDTGLMSKLSRIEELPGKSRFNLAGERYLRCCPYCSNLCPFIESLAEKGVLSVPFATQVIQEMRTDLGYSHTSSGDRHAKMAKDATARWITNAYLQSPQPVISEAQPATKVVLSLTR